MFITTTPLKTDRLELIPATVAILTSDLHHDHQELGRLLDAAIPSGWPPPLLEQDVLAQFITMLSEGSDPHFSTWYWVLNGPQRGDRILIGSGGTGSSGASDSVAIGYSVLDRYQQCGYATEAVRRLIPAIFSDRHIRRIVATTYPELKASIRVLEKAGFVRSDEKAGGNSGMEEGTLLFVLDR